jgi:hypothetical protein
MLRCRVLGVKGAGSIREPEVEPCTVVISQNGKDLLVASCALCRARVEPPEHPFPVVPPTPGSCRALEACPRNKFAWHADRAAEVRTHPTRWVTAPAGARIGARMGRHGLERMEWIDVQPGFRMCFGHDRTDKAPRAMMHTAMAAMATKYPLAAPRPAL